MNLDPPLTGSAESAILLTEKMASEKQERMDMNTVRILADAITKAIGDNAGDRRFIDISRIPLICLSITNIHKNLEEIKEMVEELDAKFATKLTEKIVYGLVGLILTAFFVALSSMIIQK